MSEKCVIVSAKLPTKTYSPGRANFDPVSFLSPPTGGGCENITHLLEETLLLISSYISI